MLFGRNSLERIPKYMKLRSAKSASSLRVNTEKGTR